jgi:pSer/pThr/pTyr-binding forkhead associated (FHA) protein
MPQQFGYDVYLQKLDDSELTVGCSRDNNIVLPHTQSRRHPLRIFYLQNQLWAEEKKCRQKVNLDGTPLSGIRCLQQGATIKIGKTTIELIER